MKSSKASHVAAGRPTRRWALAAGAAIWLRPLQAVAGVDEMLVISRQVERSVIADIGMRVVGEAVRRADLSVRFVPLPLLRSLEQANLGEIDGDVSRISMAAERYANLMLVPTPVNQLDVAVYGTEAITRLSRKQVAGLAFAYTRGALVLVKHSRGLNAIEVRSVDHAFDMLESRRVEAVMASYLDAEQSLAANARPAVRRWPEVWASEPLHLVLHKKRAGLVPRLDAALKAMAAERLIERYRDEALREARLQPFPGATSAPMQQGKEAGERPAR